MVRRAGTEDLDAILSIVGIAKKYMQENGNGTQWAGAYPSEEDFRRDIEKEQLYVCCLGERVYGVFAFIIGEEPNYRHIEDGEWLNEEPYGTIHRIASNGTVKGVFEECIAFAKGKIKNIRIDTHADNHTMQHLIGKNGFQKCGTVYMEDGSPRLAYQYAG